MKKILFLLLVSSQILMAQVPQAFNYQGIARDLSGVPLANKPIKVRLSILSEAGTIQTTLYSETHNLISNQFGLFALPVGKGTVVSGNFASIAWIDATKKLLKSEIDPDGNGYSLNATSDLQSVPFALSAKTVETENQKLTLVGNLLSISQGNTVDISGITGTSNTWIANGENIHLAPPYKKVGIGTTNPGNPFTVEVNSDGPEREIASFVNRSTSNNSRVQIGINSGSELNRGISIGYVSENYTGVPYQAGFGVVATLNKGLMFTLYDQSVFKVKTGMQFGNNIETPDRFHITALGNIGISTSTPTQKLDINGKVRIQDLGLNNTASKIIVADATGVLGFRDVSSFGSGTSQWVNDGNKIYYSLGDVIIGNQAINTPSFAYKRLHINSEIPNPTQWDSQVGITSETPGGVTRVNFVSNLNSVNAQIESGREVNNASNSNGYLSFKTRSNANADIGSMLDVMRLTSLGNVGIGTTAPTQKLDVNGKVRIQDLAINTTATKLLVADATGVLGYRDLSTITGSSQWTNVSGGINYSTGKVLIGDATSPHTSSLIISKVASGANRTFLVTQNNSNDVDANNGNYFFAGTGDNLAGLDITVNAKSYFPALGTSGYAFVRSEKLALTAAGNNSTDAFITFITGGDNITNPTGGVERMRIDRTGNIGMGTSAPKTQLHVKGAVYLEDANQGFIMKSPNGQCWRVLAGDTGALTSTSVVCP